MRGIAKMLDLETGDKTRLFITPISFDPRAPYSPISYPNDYAARVVDAIGGLYKTCGWDHDTSALNDGAIDEGEFLREMNTVETQRRAMLMKALAGKDWNMLVWVSTATDRVAHMFYRLIDPGHPMYDAALAKKYGDAIEHEYERMDATVGKVVAQLRPDDTLLIISDHGFHDFRWGLHVNQWLRQNGLLALQNGAESTPHEFFMDVDWSHTKAYALGTGQVYLNLRGREREGVVTEAEAPTVLQQIRTGLLALRDPAHGNGPVLHQVYLGKDVFQGRREKDAPDLQLAYNEYYRTAWETVLGGTPPGLIVDNDKKWSGDHAASDVTQTSGIIVSNRPLGEHPRIVDMAATAATFFGEPRGAHWVGQSVLAGQPIDYRPCGLGAPLRCRPLRPLPDPEGAFSDPRARGGDGRCATRDRGGQAACALGGHRPHAARPCVA